MLCAYICIYIYISDLNKSVSFKSFIKRYLSHMKRHTYNYFLHKTVYNKFGCEEDAQTYFHHFTNHLVIIQASNQFYTKERPLLHLFFLLVFR
jgi:hypothetical protein